MFVSYDNNIGTYENNPAIHRWGMNVTPIPSPYGTKKKRYPIIPTNELAGYFQFVLPRQQSAGQAGRD